MSRVARAAVLLLAGPLLSCAGAQPPAAGVLAHLDVQAQAPSAPPTVVSLPTRTPAPVRVPPPSATAEPSATATPEPSATATPVHGTPAPAPTSTPRPLPEPPPPGPVVTLGDSITYGYGTGVTLQPYGPAPAGSYPWDMQRDLGIPVVNAGVSGTMAREVLDPSTQPGITRPAALQLPALLALHPRLMVVGYGSNEAMNGLTVEQAGADLDALLGRIAAAHVPLVIVGTHVDCAVCSAEVEAFGANWDAVLTALASTYHAGLVLDVEQGLTPAEMTDFIHPDAAGYAVVAQRVGAAVQSRLAQV
jgi:lysophospholipase L1-like esterase